MILVTGSAGRIGSALVAALLARGERVRGFDLRSNGLVHSEYSEVVGAFEAPGAARAAVKDTEAVFHLGAFMSWLAADTDTLFRANVEGTRHLLEAMQAQGVARLIFASSGEVYPENAPEFQPVTEDHPTRPRSQYGLTKLLGEELVAFYSRAYELKTTILRFSHTQNARELLDQNSFFSGPRFFLQSRIRQQETFGNAAAVRALKAVDDGNEALVLARNENGRAFKMHITDTRDMVVGLLVAYESQATIGETYNLGATEPVAFDLALPMMAQATGLPLRVVDLTGAGVFYETSNRKFRDATGFVPQWPFERMIAEATKTWMTRRKS